MRDVQERYLEDDGKLHKTLIVAMDIMTDTEPEPEDSEETKALLRHEALFNTLSIS